MDWIIALLLVIAELSTSSPPPAIVKGSRRRRIALGSGTSVQAVNQLLAQYEQMKKLFKAFSSAEHGFKISALSAG
ncbi:hypothetical protein AGMMS49957_18840 [Synergistales bacterium]|nr:hypothetical protein AGMMS49957_18840 [Synergistales bacterium]